MNLFHVVSGSFPAYFNIIAPMAQLYETFAFGLGGIAPCRYGSMLEAYYQDD